MRRLTTIPVLLVLVASLATVAAAQPAPSQGAAAANGVCIREPDIVSETRPDDFTIIFKMRHNLVYKNTLPARCFGLKSEPAGFTYQPTDPGTAELCSRQVTIRLNSLQSVCQLGNFSRVP